MKMLPIYAILLFINQIFCGGSYDQTQINAIIDANQTMITNLQSDQVQMDLIHQQFDSQAQIVITNNPDLLN